MIQEYQDTMTLLLEQHSAILKMSRDKQAKHLPRILDWIEELSECLDEEMKAMVG